MEDIKNNKMFWVLIIVTIFNVGLFFVGKMVIDKAADRVIEKLQKEYSPSPYGPGFDPDLVNPNVFKDNAAQPKKIESVPFKTSLEIPKGTDVMREGWEKERGFSPEP